VNTTLRQCRVRVDRELVQVLEWSSARSTALHAEAVAAVSPASGAAVEWFDGAALVALGEGRYVNRAVGVGLGRASAADVFDVLERFFGARSMPASAEVSPWVTAQLLAEARLRGYVLDWFRNVYARQLDELPPRAGELEITDVDASTFEEWREILSGESPRGSAERTVSDEFCDARHRVPGAIDLVGRLRGRPVATGSLSIDRGIASLGGAATRLADRGQGAQRAMLLERLHRARDAGASLATATAVPDGSSARNLTAVGFQLLYTQVVLTRPVSRPI
jgi:hypothetical protein